MKWMNGGVATAFLLSLAACNNTPPQPKAEVKAPAALKVMATQPWRLRLQVKNKGNTIEKQSGNYNGQTTYNGHDTNCSYEDTVNGSIRCFISYDYVFLMDLPQIRWQRAQDHNVQFKPANICSVPKVSRTSKDKDDDNDTDETKWCVIQMDHLYHTGQCPTALVTVNFVQYCRYTYDIADGDPEILIDDGINPPDAGPNESREKREERHKQYLLELEKRKNQGKK